MTTASPLAIEEWPIARLRSDPRNPRVHPPAQVRKIAASIERFGWTNPVLVDADDQVIAGEARLEAARQLRRKTVPVIVLEHLSGAERRAYQIADNRLPEGAGWNEPLLAEVIAEINEAGFDSELTGFDDEELAALLAAVVPEGDLAPEDVVPLPQPDTVTRAGDVWILDAHRLICGDSTSPETLKALLGFERARTVIADLVFTDPPYGMAYEGGRAKREVDLVFTDPPYGMKFGAGKEAGSTAKGALVKAHGTILGDDAQGEALVSLVGQALATARQVARDGAAFYVCLTWRTYTEFLAALAEADLELAACIVWDKGSIGLGHQHYRPRHEFIFYCRGERWYGGRDQGDVWLFSRGRTEDYVHPTQKPVELVARAIENSSLPGHVVLDLFGGSGSTLIACERLSRRARLVELDPKYCDVIMRRWQNLTGKTALLEADGHSFEELAKARGATED